MNSEGFSTRTLPPRDQFDAWRGWFHPAFESLPRQPPEEGFIAETRVSTLDGFGLSQVSAPAIRVVRTRTLIRRNPVDHWVITIGRRARSSIGVDGSWLDVPAGVPFVLSMASEFVSERDHDERVQIYLSRDRFREIAPVLDAARGMTLDTPMGHLLAGYIDLLARSLPDLSAEERPRLTGALAAMVGACVAPSPARLAAAAGQIDLGRLEKVRRAVRRYLRAPSLGPALLCRHVGTSRSQLYRLLEGEGGVARYIQRQRLLESYALLSDPANGRPIAAIAEELCFADASGFSRAFRQEFAVSPSDVRTAARAGLVAAGLPKEPSDGLRGGGLSDCLRAF